MAVIQDGVGSNLAGVNATNQLKVIGGVDASGAPAEIGGVRNFSEVDSGASTGAALLRSPEADADYRQRVGIETLLDDETFNYVAQNTGKHTLLSTTMTQVYGTGGLLTNGASITTAATGVAFSTYASFPFLSSGVQMYYQFEASFSNQPVANTIIDAGGFIRGAANPYAPTDGVYYRLNSSGIFGVVNHNGTETTTSVLPFTYVNNEVNQYLIVANNDRVEFWINDTLYGSIVTPVGQGQPFMSASVPFSYRHAIVGGAAGGVFQTTFRGYGISMSGPNTAKPMGVIGNAVHGSYQGLSGGTMGSLANYANSANPTAAVPTNTTAALGSGLGGQFWETDTLAATTDGIICNYQVPVGGVSQPSRRLAIYGVTVDSHVQTALTGGGYVDQLALCFGHTALSLATAEGAASKAPRRAPIGVRSVAAGALAGVNIGRATLALSQPIYVNPGEFVAIARKKIGVAPSAGVIAHVISFDYSWE